MLGPYITSYKDIRKNVQGFFQKAVSEMITAASGNAKSLDVLRQIKKSAPYIRFEPQNVLTLQFLASLTPNIGVEPDQATLKTILTRAASPEQGKKLNGVKKTVHEAAYAAALAEGRDKSTAASVARVASSKMKWLEEQPIQSQDCEGKQTDVVEQYIELLEFLTESNYESRREGLGLNSD